MPVRVSPMPDQPREGDMCIIRQSPDCHFMTCHWWGDGCITVCPPCSKLPEVTDASMRELCARDGWGPVPEENTDLGG